MSHQYAPEVGSWYKNEEGDSFEVVAVDEEGGSVDIQYFDGSVESIDTDTWYEMEIGRRAPPEDWSGPFDDIEPRDMDDGLAAVEPEDWSNPLDNLEFDE